MNSFGHLVVSPFPHMIGKAPFSDTIRSATLDWFETIAPWKLRVASFYEQWEMLLQDKVLPPNLHALLGLATVDTLKGLISDKFGAKNVVLTEVTAHKLIQGQTIRIHNDYCEGAETHRVLVQLNRRWSDENGGLLMLFGSAATSDLKRVIKPVDGLIIAFEISPTSFHAVSEIKAGERYTLVYSFRET